VLLLDTTLPGVGHCTEDAISSRRKFVSEVGEAFVSEVGEALPVATFVFIFFGILKWLSIIVVEPELRWWEVASNVKVHA